MGLLDDITGALGGANLDDQGKAALKQGLLTMGLNMLAGKGNAASVIGQSGLAGAQVYQASIQQQQQQARQAKQDEMQAQLHGLQLKTGQQALDDAKAAAEQRQRQQQFLASMPSPEFQAGQTALSGGGGPTTTNAARMTPVDPQASAMLSAVRAGVLPVSAYLDSTRKDTSPITLKEGESLVDRRTYQPLAFGLAKASDTPGSLREYQFAVGQGYKGTFDQWDLARKQAGAQTITMGSLTPVTFKDGSQGFVQAGNKPGAPPQVLRLPDGSTPAPTKDASKLTESEGNAAAFLMRAQNAIDNLNKVPTISNGDYLKGNIPMGMGNFMMSKQGQLAQNAEKQFIAAVLRKESGASISNGEYQSYGEQFFPRPGDTPEKLDQKATNRQVAIEGMRVQSGPEGAKKAATGLSAAQRLGPGSMPLQGGRAPAGQVKFLGFE